MASVSVSWFLLYKCGEIVVLVFKDKNIFNELQHMLISWELNQFTNVINQNSWYFKQNKRVTARKKALKKGWDFARNRLFSNTFFAYKFKDTCKTATVIQTIANVNKLEMHVFMTLKKE